MHRHARKWAPYRTIASWYLWESYDGLPSNCGIGRRSGKWLRWRKISKDIITALSPGYEGTVQSGKNVFWRTA